MKTHTYFALTIGPIYKTLAFARRTREFWAASYIFSHLMENIVNEINTKQFGEVILPIALNSTNDTKTGAGLYPDRLIVQVTELKNEIDVKKHWHIFNNIINRVYFEYVDRVFNRHKDESIQEFIDNYLQIYTTSISLTDKEDPIKAIFPLLDTMEQQPAFNSKFTKNILKSFLENVSGSYLYEAAFEEKNDYRFPSVFEIAASGLKHVPVNNTNDQTSAQVFDSIFEKYSTRNIEDDDKLIIGELKNKFNDSSNNIDNRFKDGERFRHHHKYMAVIQADGDDMGKLLRALFEYGGTKAIQSFSGFLMDFGYQASLKIKNYDGVPVYLGGDDMLFFAPVKNGEKSIFKLVNQLDKLFKKMLQENTYATEAINSWNKGIDLDIKRKQIQTPKLSFGCAISYYKYPLKEAIEAARSLLFDTAKQVPGKNAISFRLLKHSGHRIGASFTKSGQSWLTFRGMLADKELNKIFLSSIKYKLEALRPVLKRIMVGRATESNNANYNIHLVEDIIKKKNQHYLFKNLSANFYNEGAKHEISRKFIDSVLFLLLDTYDDMLVSHENNYDTADNAIDSVYSCLRIMQFFNQPDYKEDEL